MFTYFPGKLQSRLGHAGATLPATSVMQAAVQLYSRGGRKIPLSRNVAAPHTSSRLLRLLGPMTSQTDLLYLMCSACFFSLPQPMPLRTIADSISHLPFQVRCRQGSWRNCRGDPGTGSRWPTHQGARHFTSTVFLVGDKTPAGRNHHGLACQLIKCSRSRCGLTAEELQTCCCFTVLQCRREQTRSLSSYMAMAYRLMSAGVEVRDFSGHGLVGLPFHFR